MGKEFKAGDWISVADGHPNDCEDVLVVVSGTYRSIAFKSAIELATWYDDCGYVLEAYPEFEDCNVSHWMRIPEFGGGREA